MWERHAVEDRETLQKWTLYVRPWWGISKYYHQMKEQIKTLKSILSSSERQFTKNNNSLNLVGMNPLLQSLQKTVELSINGHKELVRVVVLQLFLSRFWSDFTIILSIHLLLVYHNAGKRQGYTLDRPAAHRRLTWDQTHIHTEGQFRVTNTPISQKKGLRL